MDPFIRSLFLFYSSKAPVSRTKNNKTKKDFDLLIKNILVKEDIIEEWRDKLSNRSEYTIDKFYNCLFDGLCENKISLIQAGQMLALRAGRYDEIGVYYDASASAYQIMGVLTGDKSLCNLTNVIKYDKETKSDIYSVFLKKLKPLLKNKKLDVFKNENFDKNDIQYFINNFDRKIIKAIIMPLIYGKTPSGFADDLKDFFKKGDIYPSKGVLLQLASQIIRELNNDPIFNSVNLFMAAMRTFAGMLSDIDYVYIFGPYNRVNMKYNEETIDRINIYAAYKNKSKVRYRINRVNLTKVSRDSSGKPLRSKRKIVNAFVANFIHYLDSYICHQLIDEMMKEQKPIGTIHDCFYVRPNDSFMVNKHYKYGLIKAMFISKFNFYKWVYALLYYQFVNDNDVEEEKEFVLEKLADYMNYLITLIFEDDFKMIFNKDIDLEGNSWIYDCFFVNEETKNALHNLISKIKSTKIKKKWYILLQFFNTFEKDSYFEIIKSLMTETDDFCIFPDNA